MNSPKLTNISVLRELLTTHQISPKKARGQNFLISERIVNLSARALKEKPSRNVTELGCGIGTLTQGLLEAGFTVRGIEVDRDLLPALESTTSQYPAGQFSLFTSDLRKTTWEWDTPYQLAGNIPYNLSGFIVRRLTLLTPAPEQAVLLMQKEVVDRLTSTTHMSLPRLAVELWGTARRIALAQPGCFVPPPKVVSALAQLVPHASSPLSVEDREEVLTIARHAFQKKRKQLLPTLAQGLSLDRKKIEEALLALNISAQARSEQISTELWVSLWQALRVL